MADSLWRKKDFLYLPKKKITRNYSEVHDSFIIQDGGHQIRNSLQNNDTTGFQNTRQCYFTRYNNPSAYRIYSVPAHRYYLKVNESGPNLYENLFYCSKLILHHRWRPSWTSNWYNYYGQLINYYLGDDNWRGEIWQNNNIYLLAGINAYSDVGQNLHLIKHINTYSGEDPTIVYDLMRIQGTYFYTTGNGHWMELNTGRRDYFYEDYTSLNMKTAQRISDDLAQIDEFDNEPDCEVYFVGMPRGPLFYDPDFTNDELMTIIRMMCELNGGTCYYTALIEDIVEHDAPYTN